MQLDLSAVETGTMVFIGTLVFGLVITLFMTTAAVGALLLVGAARLAWLVVSRSLVGLVRGINHAWDRLVHHASTVELPGDFSGQTSPSTGTYPRVVLRDS